MNIYSNSFFHRTQKYSYLKSIIEDGLKVFYCKEEFLLEEKGKTINVGIPMVCFCDIPLSFLSRNNYGKYGIALSRNWGNIHKLEPVLYYPNNKECQSTKMVVEAAEFFHKENNKKKDFSRYRILGYAKPVRKINETKDKNKDNYAEREWRRVYSSKRYKWKKEEEYKEYRGSNDSDKKPVGTPMKFKIDDIDFIIVAKSDLIELKEFIIRDLKTIGGYNKNGITDDERYSLLSKILVYEDLKDNL